MDDGLFESRISQESLYRNRGLPRILCAKEEFDSGAVQPKKPLTLVDLVNQVRTGQTIEHMLPQEPSFGIRLYGFSSREAYDEQIHKIGNLTLIEKSLNSSCNNQSVETKMANKDLYKKSDYQMTRLLAAKFGGRQPAFTRTDIDIRGAELAKFCVSRWPLW